MAGSIKPTRGTRRCGAALLAAAAVLLCGVIADPPIAILDGISFRAGSMIKPSRPGSQMPRDARHHLEHR